MTTPIFQSCLDKQENILKRFSPCKTRDDTYQMIIQIGKEQAPLSEESKIEQNRVAGCQSTLYLETKYENGRLFFRAESDALISQGLAALVTLVYSDETPESVMRCPHPFLDQLKINEIISPSRASGLSSILIKMKQQALKYYAEELLKKAHDTSK